MDSPWRLDQRQARLEVKTFRADIDLDRPESGLDRLSFAGRSLAPAQLLGVELPASDTVGDRFVEAYLRGNDLIATYADVSRPSFRWQVYWRAISGRYPQALAAIEAIVSVQTGLLDSWPQLSLRSLLPATGVWLWRAGGDGVGLQCERVDPGPTAKTVAATESWGCFDFALAGTHTSYLEMVHPADFDTSSVERHDAAGVSLRHGLFRERLEKGVILRSRALALFLPSRPTNATIADIQRAFANEELPLTT